MNFLIREMTQNDIGTICPLLHQLGYELSVDEIEQRVAAVMAMPGHRLTVGIIDDQLVSLLHIYMRPALEKPPEIIVQALVVDSNCRQQGIGKTMMESAEIWAKENGFSSVALTSNVSRNNAHAFYKALSYDIIATSHLFRKKI